MASEKSHDTLWSEWTALVNLRPAALERWLTTDESRSVGVSADGGESTGHRSGREIVKILRAGRDDLSEAQWDHVAKVVGYIKRHKAQGGPEDDVAHSRWRYSLMNWGHDPLG